MKRTLLLAAYLLSAWRVSAQPLAFAEIFGERMVLQRQMPVRVWGTAEPNAEVCVEIEGRSAMACADSRGDWNAVLPELEAGGPYRLHLASGPVTRTIDAVYVGEVWIAGGQSNMGFQVSQLTEEQKRRVIAAAKNSSIRFVTVPKILGPDEKPADNRLEWNSATEKRVIGMSAVAYFFAEKLQPQIGVPLGVIVTPHGGSAAEAWFDREALRGNPKTHPLLERYEEYMTAKTDEGARADYEAYLQQAKAYNSGADADRKSKRRPLRPYGPYSQYCPGGLYETMLKRVIPFTARGVVWYQGESNNARAEQYRTLLPLLIGEWRREFLNPEMYFGVVQLPAYRGPKIQTWPEVREAQLLTSRSIDRVGLAVTIDAGARDDLHPGNKRPVGERLAALAANDVYGIAQPCRGPELLHVQREGIRLALTFDVGAGRLAVAPGEALRGFCVAGADMRFVPAQACHDGNQVQVWADQVPEPVAVRYGWANWTDCNLCNEAGFPASPFRTDSLPLVTTGVYK